MFSRRRSLPDTTQAPAHAGRTAHDAAGPAGYRLASLTTLNIGLTAVAAIGPRRIRPHAQAILALIGAVQAIISLLRKS